MTSTTPAFGRTVGYQDLGGDAYEIIVDGQATLGAVLPVGEAGWVAISGHGAVLGNHPSKTTAAVAVAKEWETHSSYRRL